MNTLRRLALMGACLVCSLSFAQEMRLAEGQSCRPTEKTYFGMDGKTVFACEPQGGPAYAFKVFVDDQLAWEGSLKADQPQALAPLSRFEGTREILGDQLVVGRCFDQDPSGETLFFGRRRLVSLAAFETQSSGQALPDSLDSATTRLQLPQYEDAGYCVRAPKPGRDAESLVNMRNLPEGPRVYRLVARRL